MTELNNEAIEEAPDVNLDAANESEAPQEDIVEDQEADTSGESDGGEGEFPKKAVNALNRKNKQINKLRAQMRELEQKLHEVPKLSLIHI